jgi:septum formation protein
MQSAASGVPLVLASASPRRRALLERSGVPFHPAVPCITETHTDRPREDVARNARAKHDWARARFPRAAVLAADTVVALGARVFPKPSSRAEAAAFFRMLSGQTHQVFTGIVFSRPGAAPREHVAVSAVTFRTLDDAAIADYFARVDPLDKAGGYDIDQHGARIVSAYTGSYSTIMGLPLEVILPWLR